MENFEQKDLNEIEWEEKLKKLEELAPQSFDYAKSLATVENRDEFFHGIEVLNGNVAEMPPAEGSYEQIHFRTTGPQSLSAQVFENGRITFQGSWHD